MKALIIAPAWVGDMVMAHTLVQCLARRHDLTLHIAAPAATAPVAQRMAEVDTVHTLAFDHGELGLAKRRALGVSLRAEKYDVAFVLPNSWKSALVPFFARVPKRVGWAGEARFVLLNDWRRLDKQRYPLMIERFMALADPDGSLPGQPYPLPRLNADETNARRLLAEHDLPDGPVSVLCPGAEYGAAKKWPGAHYASVARALLERGRQVWLMGSPNDVEDCAAIARCAPGVRNLAGRTSLADAIDLLSLADEVVCNDSGLMHIACALGRRTVGVFGSTSAQFTPPLGRAAAVAELDLPCRPCFERECPLGHMDCLNKLLPEQVIGQLRL